MQLFDRDVFFVTAMGILLLVLMVVFFVLFVLQYRRRQMAFVAEKMKIEKEYNEEILRTQLELSEQVMQNISEEIHDNIGQSLTVAKLQIHGMNTDNFKERGQMANELITRSLKDLRNLSRTLNGEYILREGFQAALCREVELINSGKGLQCGLRGEVPFNCLEGHAEIILFRSVQEALSNGLRHSGADRIDIDIVKLDQRLKVSITDNGRGLPASDEFKKGLGMENMKKRITLLKGKVSFDSVTGKGTTVVLELPC